MFEDLLQLLLHLLKEDSTRDWTGSKHWQFVGQDAKNSVNKLIKGSAIPFSDHQATEVAS